MPTTELDQSLIHSFKQWEWLLSAGAIGYNLSDVDGEHYRTLVRFASGAIEPASKVLRLTLTPQRPQGVNGSITVHYLLRNWNAADWAYTAQSGDPARSLWGTAGAKGLTDISNPVTAQVSGEQYVPFTVDIDVSDYPIGVFSQFGLRLIGGTGIFTCAVSAKLLLTWPEYTATAASLSLPAAGIIAPAFYANEIGHGALTLPPPGLAGAGYYLPPGYELLGHLTLPEWFSGDAIMSQISTQQPLRFFLRAADGSAAIAKTPVVEIRKHDAPAWTTPLGAVSEVGHGWYQVAYNAADQDEPGQLLLRATAADCHASGACYLVMGDTNPYAAGPVEANVIQIDGSTLAAQIAKLIYSKGVRTGAVADYSPTATSFLTSLPVDQTNHYQDQVLFFTSGNDDQEYGVVLSSATEGSLTRITLVSALTAAPENGSGLAVLGCNPAA